LAAIRHWYDALPRTKKEAKGTIAAALVLLERLKNTFDLNLASHLTPGGGQIRGLSGDSVKKILASFDETRPFTGVVGGRSNRGSPAIAETLLKSIRSVDLDNLDIPERQAVLREVQEFFVEKVGEFHKRQCLKPIYDPAQSTRRFIADLLALAEKTGKRGPVAQYLVGAKLQLRFPEIEVRKESYSAADAPSGQPGDFVVQDTTFHVTVAPTADHFEKCKRNLQEGRRVFLLVPGDMLAGARQNAELVAPGRITVESIESFVANSIELEARFSAISVETLLSQLCENFNSIAAKWTPDEWLSLEIVHV